MEINVSKLSAPGEVDKHNWRIFKRLKMVMIRAARYYDEHVIVSFVTK